MGQGDEIPTDTDGNHWLPTDNLTRKKSKITESEKQKTCNPPHPLGYYTHTILPQFLRFCSFVNIL